jgi:hypothetical protein
MRKANSNRNEIRDDVDQTTSQLLVNLHIAEYQALTARNTNWITLQFALWSILGIYVAVLSQAFASIPRELVIWGSAIVVQMIGIALNFAGYEQYNTIKYIEENLRAQLECMIGKAQFWGYEAYLAGQRPKTPKSMWWEWFYMTIG